MFDYVDVECIGVYGYSYGGYMMLMIMFKVGDYFVVGVLGVLVIDWCLYDIYYIECYMGNLNIDDDVYIVFLVFFYVKDLKGDFLIYYGMVDDNVLFIYLIMFYKYF